MRALIKNISVFVLMATVITGGGSVFAQHWSPGTYTPKSTATQRNRWENRHSSFFSFLNSPSKPTPTEQFLHADRARKAGKLKKAAKMHRALLAKWPQSESAPASQLALADIYYELGKLHRAFDEYQYLIEAYAGFFPYDEVVQKQTEIARKISLKRYWLLFVPYSAPEEALPMLEKIVENAPHAKGSDEMQLEIADLYLQTGEYELAIEAYLTARQRYTQSPLSERANYGYALSCLNLSRDFPNSGDYRESAVYALSGFLREFPESEFRVEAQKELSSLRTKQAKDLYSRARTYDRKRHKPHSAMVVYRQLVEEFPESHW
ncbi:MAG: outer membrane protein assembly factor BamD, partial [Lentisphaerae bacterium]|nr:outer membrane protein assembly factor BamD [Lentisphaerota bacterium]